MSNFLLFLGLLIVISSKVLLHNESNYVPVMSFVVSIQQLKSFKYKHICVGSIIHKKFIVTAAHCFESRIKTSQLSIYRGNNLSYKSGGERRKVVKVKVHAEYYPLYGSDIALIEVSPEYDFSEISSIKIDNLNGKKTSGAFLCGWDAEMKGLVAVKFKTITNELCKRKGFSYITGTEVCAVSLSGRGACEGNSGGPLVTSDLKSLIGILSYGKTSCAPRRILVFTNVIGFRPWIKETISKMLRG